MKKFKSVSIVFICLLTIACTKNEEPSFILEGTWEADGTQYKFIIDKKGDDIVTTDSNSPLSITIDKDCAYNLKFGDYTESGTCSIDENNEVGFITKEGILTEYCQLKNDNELYCERYASIYI